LHFSGAYDPVVSVGMQAAFGFPASTNLSHGETFVSEQRKKNATRQKVGFVERKLTFPGAARLTRFESFITN
jgi:hypothetical protein